MDAGTVQGNHVHLARREELFGCQQGLSMALSMHHHAGEPGAAGVDKQSTQVRHQQRHAVDSLYSAMLSVFCLSVC